MEEAIFGAGCFWGVESVFRQIDGVEDVVCGYSGGTVDNPTYEEVYKDSTGHAEVVKVVFDKAVVSYGELVEFFFMNHDPTQLNCQAGDVGTRYRSVIFACTPEQERIALEKKQALTQSKRFEKPIVTTVESARAFWRAEDFHQRYYEKDGLPTCQLVRRWRDRK